MRVLKFVVDGQKISLDPKCDFNNLIPGSQGYLEAEFSFSKEWESCTKVAGFYSNLGTEYPPQVLKGGRRCTIPAEALKKSIFKVKVFGQRGDYNICTNRVAVQQNGGNE